jgi:cytochrome c-type protein NapC
MTPDNRRPTDGWLRRLMRPATYYSFTGLTLAFLAGIIFWGGFHTVVEWTNTERFCISCHEMYDNVYLEYRDTVHYSNRTGVRAVCSDCHVPREWGPKMMRKIAATRELYGKVTGSISTSEKFEEKRLQLARREWKRMVANDSLECRNCHSLESMDKDGQSTRARRQHANAVEQGITCIACHQGIAHQLPEGMTDDDYFD